MAGRSSHRTALSTVQAAVIAAVVIIAAVGGYVYYASLVATPAKPAPEEILIGAVLPLTGGFAREGAFFKTGYELATKEVNDGGGLFVKEFGKKIPVRLIILDDESDKAKTVRLLEELVTARKVHVLLGGYSTPLVQAQVVVPEREKIPYVNGGGASTEIYVTQDGKRRSEWVFGLLAVVKELSKTTMDFLKDQVDKGVLSKPVKISMVWQNTAHGRDYRDGVEEKMREYPGYFELVLNEPFDFEAKDFTALLLKVKAKEADVFLSDSHLPHYLLMHRQYIEQGMYGTHKIVSHGARGPEKTALDQFKDKAEYLIAALWWTDQLPYPPVKKFVESWQKVSNLPPNEWYPAFAYETARTLYRAIEQSGSLDKEKMRDAIQKIVIQDALVPGQKIFFSKEGLLNHPYIMVQNLPGGKVAVVWPLDAAQAAAKLIPRTPK